MVLGTVKSMVRLLSLAVVVSLCALGLNIQPVGAVTVSPKPLITVAQDNLLVSATVDVADNQTVGKVTVKVGDATAVTLAKPDVDGNYSKLLTRANFGTKIIFTATAIDENSVESEVTTSSAYTFTAAAAPTAINIFQDDLVVSAEVVLAPRTTVGRVTVKVGTSSPLVLLDDGSGAYSIELTRASIGKQIIFTATAVSDDALPDSDAITSSPFVLAVTSQPSAISVSQSGYDLTVNVTVPNDHSIGTVTIRIGSGRAEELVATGDSYTYSMDDSELSKTFIFTATAISNGPIESSPLASAPFVPVQSRKPVAISLVQDGWNVNASFDLVAGSDLGSVFYTVDGGSPTYLDPNKSGMTLEFSPTDLGKVVVVQASAMESNFPESAYTASRSFVISKSATPASITLTQSGLVVTAAIKAPTLGVITSVKVSVDGSNPSLVSPENGNYRVTLTRADFGKSVVFTATSRKLTLPESDEFSSAPLIFSVATKPSFVSVTKAGLLISVIISAGEGQSVGSVFAVIDGGTPKVVSASQGVYLLTLTRDQIGKPVVFSATATKSARAESDPVFSEPVTVSIAASPTFGVVTQNGLSAQTTVSVESGQTIKSVTASVGGGTFTKAIATNGTYSVKLVAGDVGKTIIFKAIASTRALPDSDPALSAPLIFTRAAPPIFSELNQNLYAVSVRVTSDVDQTIGAVEYSIDGGKFKAVVGVDGLYTLTLKRAYLGMAITFRAKAKESKKLDSDYALTDPLIFSSATAPTFTSVTQVDFVTTAVIDAGEGQTLEKVLVKVGTAKWRVIEPVDGQYVVTGTSKDLGKKIVFSATATKPGLLLSDPVLSSELTVSKASAPVIGKISQSGLTVLATIEAGDGQTLGPVYVNVGQNTRQIAKISRGQYRLVLTRADLGKSVTFTTSARKKNAADSNSVTSSAYVFAAAKKPISIKVSQKGLVLSIAVKNFTGQATGIVTASIDGAKAKRVKPVKGAYSLKVTRAQVGKQVVFTATSTQSGLVESDPILSKKYKIRP